MQHWIKTHPARAIGLLLLIVTFAAYWPVIDAEFTNYDDNVYVVENPRVNGGLSLSGIVWAFTAVHEATWQPLTWISYMLDAQLFGLNAQAFHFTNLLLHLLNTLLLLHLLRRLTGSLWPAALVAGLFALHPLHVESVAWIAERKDVLSTLFWLLAMLAYVRYVEEPGLRRYLPLAGALALGLMAKPMLVTLPFVLLLLDHWPLDRLTWRGASPAGNRARLPWWKLVLEKTPLFAMAAASSVITYNVQQADGAVRSTSQFPLLLRLPQVVISYAEYIEKMVWPAGLSVLYPITGASLAARDALVAGLLLGGLLFASFIVRWRGGTRFAYLVVGWLWYLGTLVPVIGFVQIGSHAMADRFTYVPLIGLFIILAWGGRDLYARIPGGHRQMAQGGFPATVRTASAVLTAAGLCVILAICTWKQAGHWKNSVRLFQHAVSVTTNNLVAQSNLGLALMAEGRVAESLDPFRAAIAADPTLARLHYNLGYSLLQLSRLDEAAGSFNEAIRLDPENGKFRHALGIVLERRGFTAAALEQFEAAVRSSPQDPEFHYNLGVALDALGQAERAMEQYQATVRIAPDHADAHLNLAVGHFSMGRHLEAWRAVHQCQRHGGTPHPGFLAALSEQMPENWR